MAANPPPVVSVTAPVAGASYIGPTSIQLEATASSPDSTVASVTFYNNGTSRIGAATLSEGAYAYSWKGVKAGNYSITAVAKDALGASATSSAVAITVTQDPAPSVTLSAAPKSGPMLIAPATLLLSATATSADEAITSVAFLNGIKKIGTSTVPPYTFTWKAVAVGTYSLTAVATDSLGVTGDSAPVLVTVIQDPAPVIETFTAVPAAGFTGVGPETVTLTATASSPDESIASVTFDYNGNSKIGTVTKATNGQYVYSWKGVGAGTYTLTATATDTLGTPSSPSTPVTLTVAQDTPPTVSITSPADGTSVTGPATIVLVALAASSDAAIKSVAFTYPGANGAVKIGTVTKASSQGGYSYTWKGVPVGTYSVTATATDTLGVPTSSIPVGITVTQDQSPSISILTPISGATYATPASIGISAAASSPDVSIASVKYFQGTSTTALSTQTVAPYAYTWKPAGAGTYTLTAVATDSVGSTVTSAPVTVTVGSTTSTVKLTKPASGSTVAAPATVALTATATAPSGVANVGFYAGGTLLGTVSASPYQYTWTGAPAGYYYLTAVETDTTGASLTSAPIALRIDTPPSVQITTPANGSAFIVPANIVLEAAASTSGKITKVEFFGNSTLLGTSTAAPYQFTWSNVPLGTYSVTAQAFDNYNISAFSPAVSLQVVTEQPPTISLTTPTSGLTFGSTSNVSLSFSATASTSIAKVEIYRNGALVATLTSPSAGGSWTFSEANALPVGKYSYFARAYDATGASTDSATFTVTVAPVLPYLTDFETGDGFALGSLDGQVGWAVLQGSANVSSTAYSGSQGIQLVGASPAAVVQQTFSSTPGETIIFCDFYAMPTAESSIAASTVFTAEGAQFGFQGNGSGQGTLQVFQGNGSGGGTWVPANFSAPLNSSNQTQSWVRLTARLDFTKQTWDLYANGAMVAADVPFVNSSSTYFSLFQATGDASADSFFDDMYIGADNPLFADANNDGIDDAWEALYGLSLTQNDRYVNLSGDGIPVIDDYIYGTSPFINTKVTPPPVQSGLILDLRADAGVVADSNGNVSTWLDQSPAGNIAYQQNTANQPQLAPNQIHGLPALSFNGQNTMALPAGIMQTADSGEIIGVVEMGNDSVQPTSIWNFGTGYFGTAYFNTLHFDDFGSSDSSAVTVETQAQISQFYVYDTSISTAGTAIYRYNGIPLWTRTGLTVGFQYYPDIGGYGNGSLVGEIAEVILYDRVLTDAERLSMFQYLNAKYAFPAFVVPTAPTDVSAVAESSDTVDLSWTAYYPDVHTVATIYRESASSGFAQVAQVSDASSYTDTGLTAGTSYSYQVTVQSYSGSSGVSNSASVTLPSGIADLPQNGLLLWLRSTAGTQGAGSLSTWTDQSGQGNNAVQTNVPNQPTLVENQVNGVPVVRFNGSDSLLVPNGLFQAAQSGEVIALVKVTDASNFGSVWNFGTGSGTSYFGNQHYDDFGTSDSSSVALQPTEVISQYYVYDTSIDTSGNSLFRYDGTLIWSRPGLPISFSQSPDIGGNGGGFVGDIAEVIVYNRVLSSQEQATIYAYLAAKYALPSLVGNLEGPSFRGPAQASGTVGQPFSFSITATNNPTSFAALGLPPGLSIDPVAGTITGIPAAGSAGTYTVTVTATNSLGSGTENLTITVAAPQEPLQYLPYTTGFETTDGYTVGALSGQNDWVVSQGSAAITAQEFHNGVQSLQIQPSTPPTIASLNFADSLNETIEFCDFYAEPVAETSISTSTIFTVEGAQFGFQQSNGVGVLQVYWGDGLGGGTWEPTPFTIPLGSNNQAASWVRLTARLDFSAQTWSLYANGNLIIDSVPFISDSSSFLSIFQISGDAMSPSYIDDFYVGPQNPLFADVNNDGIPDAWETANGLSLATNNADANDFSPTLTDLQEFELGLNPLAGTVNDATALGLNVYAPHP